MDLVDRFLDADRLLLFFSVVCVVGLIAVAFLIFPSQESETRLFFDAHSDLPDPAFYLKSNGSVVHELEVGRFYDIVFLVAYMGDRQASFSYLVDSRLLNDSGVFTMEPGEVKTFNLSLNASEDDKWILNSSSVQEWSDIVDLSKESWVAERRELDLLVRDDGLPVLVDESFNLPVSSSVSRLGEVVHTNMSVEGLRSRAFVWNNSFMDEGLFFRTKSADYVRLWVEGDRLFLESRLVEEEFVSEPDLFSVELIGELSSEELGDLKVDYASFRRVDDRIYFWYRLK